MTVQTQSLLAPSAECSLVQVSCGGFPAELLGLMFGAACCSVPRVWCNKVVLACMQAKLRCALCPCVCATQCAPLQMLAAFVCVWKQSLALQVSACFLPPGMPCVHNLRPFAHTESMHALMCCPHVIQCPCCCPLICVGWGHANSSRHVGTKGPTTFYGLKAPVHDMGCMRACMPLKALYSKWVWVRHVSPLMAMLLRWLGMC